MAVKSKQSEDVDVTSSKKDDKEAVNVEGLIPDYDGNEEEIEEDEEEIEEDEEDEERLCILEEASELRKFAEFHLHPEKPVKTTDPNAFGRNYFSRPSAADQETVEEMDERVMILKEAALLKQYARFHLHPEMPLKTTDATIFGRNYFYRASAAEYIFDEDGGVTHALEVASDLKNVFQTRNAGDLEGDLGSSSSSGGQEFMEYDRNADALAKAKKLLILLDAANAPTPSDKPLGDLSQSYYSHSYNDEMYDDYDHHSDHFELDEDMSSDKLRVSLSKVIVGNHVDTHETFDAVNKSNDGEGNLSRSPSSVMLMG